MGDLSRCLPITLAFEGGWSDNLKDPGGATMKGVTLATFRRYRPGATKAALRAISDADLLAIYRDGFWRAVSGDGLPSGVDLAAFDYAVNSGPGAANKALAASVGLSPVERVKAICGRRLSILHGLKTWATFGKGWGARVAQIEATAIKWASGSPAEATSNLQAAANEHLAKAKAKTTGAIVASGVAAPTVTVAQSAQGPLTILAAVAFVGLAIFLFLTIRKHQDAAAALTEAAKGA
jgi:lysozyme family protein